MVPLQLSPQVLTELYCDPMEFVQQPVAQILGLDKSLRILPYTSNYEQNILCFLEKQLSFAFSLSVIIIPWAANLSNCSSKVNGFFKSIKSLLNVKKLRTSLSLVPNVKKTSGNSVTYSIFKKQKNYNSFSL